MTRVLTAGWEAAVKLRPLFDAAVHNHPYPYNGPVWRNVRWTGPARRAKTQAT